MQQRKINVLAKHNKSVSQKIKGLTMWMCESQTQSKTQKVAKECRRPNYAADAILAAFHYDRDAEKRLICGWASPLSTRLWQKLWEMKGQHSEWLDTLTSKRASTFADTTGNYYTNWHNYRPQHHRPQSSECEQWRLCVSSHPFPSCLVLPAGNPYSSPFSGLN